MKRMIKQVLLLAVVLMIGSCVIASEQDALNFFNEYVSASNNYSSSLLGMYSSNAKIIRQVVKPNGQLVNVNFSVRDYKHQMILSSKVAKIRHYKNYYSSINVSKVSNNKYRITAKRKPSASDYKLNTMMIVEKENGKWLITEELMQTKEQIFLKYAK